VLFVLTKIANNSSINIDLGLEAAILEDKEMQVNPIDIALKAQAWTILESGIFDPRMPDAVEILRHCMNKSMYIAKKNLTESFKEAAKEFKHADLSEAKKLAKEAGIEWTK
jgi:hypothetical protein